MYTRDFTPESKPIHIPDKYCGTAFDEENDGKLHNEPTPENEEKAEPAGLFSGISRLFPTKLFDGKLPFLKGGKVSFGTEEILILAIAAFLFFSKDGDRECAIILFLLLFTG